MVDFSEDKIMLEKEDLMVPFDGGRSTKTRAHFLNPLASSSKTLPLTPLSVKSSFIKLEEGRLEVDFKGRRDPQKGWKKWVDILKPDYEHIWKKAGIFEAILASTYKILRHNDLMIKLGERWCVETNTFVFPWGEVGITLEDMMILGGFSVLGDSVHTPLEREDMVEKVEILKRVHKEIRHKAKTPSTSDSDWMEHFMDSRDPLEHEAFLSLWLSRFVLPIKCNILGTHAFPIAVQLSAGIPIALAPVLLANIYRDLSLLKNAIVALAQKKVDECGLDDESKVVLWARFQLVQLWAWERFPLLGPNPNALNLGEPRAARWHRLKKVKLTDVRKALASSGESFGWRPYTTVLKNWEYSRFYWENEEYVPVKSCLDTKTLSFARCLRPSKLVGMDRAALYLPHRVARQFGFDQDIPGHVDFSKMSKKIAWRNYIRPISDTELYAPWRLFESDVTSRYNDWYLNKSTKTQENLSKCVLSHVSYANEDDVGKVGDQVDAGGSKEIESDEEDGLTIAEARRRREIARNMENNGQKSTSLATLDRKGELPMKKFADLSAQNSVCVGRPEIVVEVENLAQEKNSSQRDAIVENENGSNSVLGLVGQENVRETLEMRLGDLRPHNPFLSSKMEAIVEGENMVEENDSNMSGTIFADEDVNLAATNPLGDELEARIERVEKIIALIKAGKM